MKLIILPLFFCAAFFLSAGNIVQVDNFDLPEQRLWQFKRSDAAGGGQHDMRLGKPSGTLFVRFFGKKSLSKVELFRSDSAKSIWQTSRIGKNIRIKSTPRGEYILRFSGKLARHVEVSVRNQYGRMINWKNINARIVQREQGVVLQPNGKESSIYGRCFQLKKNKLYTLTLEAEALESQTISLVVSKHKVARRVVPFPLEAGKPVKVSAQYTLPADNGNIRIYFSKPLLVKKLTVTENGDASVSASAAVAGKGKRGRSANDGRFLEQRNEEREPADPALDKPVVYRRAPRFVYPDSIPQEYEICEKLYGFGTPGSYIMFYAVLHNPGKARPVGICTVSELRSSSGRMAAEKWEISEIGFCNYPRGKLSTQIVPELILEQSGKPLDANGNRMYRFFLKLPSDAAAGKYSGKVSFKCGETSIILPLEATVLPFKIMDPKDDEYIWSVYSRIQGRPQRTYRGAIRDRYFQDMRDAGITGLHYSISWKESSVKQLQELRKKLKFTAPPVLYGIRPHIQALKNLNLPIDDTRWFDKEAVRKEYVRLLKIFNSWMKKYGGDGYDDYYVSCVDEPFLGHMERAAWENRLAREAGLKTTGTIYQPRFVQIFAADLDMSINMFINRSPEMLKQLKELQKRYPKLHYWYLGAGAYENQEGGLMPNRLMAGLGSFRSGVKGHISFTYQNISPNHNAFRNPLRRGYGMTFPHPKPTPEKVTIFTLEWDGLREGITDYKYLYTLQKLIRQKTGTPAAKRGQQVLDYILTHTTWQEQMTHANGITARRDLTNDNIDKLRALAANAIKELISEK